MQLSGKGLAWHAQNLVFESQFHNKLGVVVVVAVNYNATSR